MLASANMPASSEILILFGEIDIYLFDQLLKGRLDSARGCWMPGAARGAISCTCETGLRLLQASTAHQPRLMTSARWRRHASRAAVPAENFVVGEVDALPWPSPRMDAVICSAVLHFRARRGALR